MKKGTRLIKRLVTLLMVLLLSIENFAAVVSDNDGSAFITKAEFDSLKNDFQSQIDKYNASIDSKIDGAIASYLAGISMTKQEIKKIVLSNWKQITMLNSTLTNDWKHPNLNLSLSFNGTKDTYSSTAYYTTWTTTSTFIYNRPDSEKSLRLMVDAGFESDTPPSYVYWMGRAKNLLDSIVIVRMQNREGGNGGYDLTHIGLAQNPYFNETNITQIFPGYYSNLGDTTTAIWNPRIFWNPNYKNYGNEIKTPNKVYAKSNVLTSVLKPVNNVYYDYKHILNYDNYTWPQLSDNDWTNTLRTMEDSSSVTRASMLSNCSKTGKWWATTCARSSCANTRVTLGEGAVTQVQNFGNYYSGDNGVNDQTKFVGVGILNNIYDSKHIYQSNEIWEETVGKSRFETKDLTLVQGLPLLAGNEGDKIIVNLEFDNMYRDGNPQTDMDIDVYLSMLPFSEGSSVSDESKRIRCEGQPEGVNYMTTKNNKIKLTWTFKEDGIAYVKWNPHDTSGYWEVDLNLAKNPTYIYEASKE